MKVVATVFGSAIAFLVVCVLAFAYFTRAPNEAKLKQIFYAHRSSFEQLRKMLETEPGEMQVIKDGRAWSVEGDKAKSYVALMKDIPATDVSRLTDRSPKPLLVITVWASGFAGDTVHAGLCWTDERPPRCVSSLDAFTRDPKSSAGTGWVFQSIEGNWYIWTDRLTGRSP